MNDVEIMLIDACLFVLAAVHCVAAISDVQCGTENHTHWLPLSVT